jgi:hypothetical protein
MSTGDQLFSNIYRYKYRYLDRYIDIYPTHLRNIRAQFKVNT